jgi:hypothetical protein
VPVTFPAAEALPPAAAELPGAAAVLLDDELHAPASSATRANTTATSVRCRLRGADPEGRSARPPDLGPSSLAVTPIACSLRG